MDPSAFGGLPTTPRELQAQNEVMKRLVAETPEPVMTKLMSDEDFRESMNDLMDYLSGAGAEVVEVGAGYLTEEGDEVDFDDNPLDHCQCGCEDDGQDGPL